MRKYSLLLALVALLAACDRDSGTYQDKDKWMLTYHMTRMTLRNRPRQVTEYICPAEDTARPEKEKSFYDRYSFNPEGTMNSRTNYMNDTPFMKFDWSIDQDGLQGKITEMSRGKVTRIVSRRQNDGSFLTISPGFGSAYRATIHRFLSGGDEVIKEEYPDSTVRGDATNVGYLYYQGNRLMKATGGTKASFQEAVYFYSHSDAPDSLRIYQGRATAGKLIQRQLFFQNDHGDVLREIVITGMGDTTRLDENTYSYDAKGNWVRRIVIPRKFDPTNPMEKEIMVMDREIVY